jgi:hypothetical protein
MIATDTDAASTHGRGCENEGDDAGWYSNT